MALERIAWLSAASAPNIIIMLIATCLMASLAASLQIPTYSNPVIDSNHPDPGVLLLADGTYVVVTTSGDSPDAFPILLSSDLVHWRLIGHVFPQGRWPSWAKKDMWAPEMHLVNGRYLVYFTGRTSNGLLSIGVAAAATPYGPFLDKGEPLLQNTTIPIGVIDATYYADNGHHYLIWKVDGNDKGITSRILMRELEPTGMDFKPDTAITQLIENDLDWESTCVEGPWVIKTQGYYYLFYSGNVFTSRDYAIGVARSQEFTGPYEKFGPPILHTNFTEYDAGKNSTFVGPGHCSVVQKDEDWWMVYHSWKWGQVLKDPPGRVMNIDKVLWNSSWPYIGSPSVGPLPI